MSYTTFSHQYTSRFLDFSGNLLAQNPNKSQTNKAIEHNRRTLFSRVMVLLMHESKVVASTLFYPLYSMHYSSSQFAPTSLFSSASVTNIVPLHQQITPPPLTYYATPLDRAIMQKSMTAYPPDLQKMPILR